MKEYWTCLVAIYKGQHSFKLASLRLAPRCSRTMQEPFWPAPAAPHSGVSPDRESLASMFTSCISRRYSKTFNKSRNIATLGYIFHATFYRQRYIYVGTYLEKGHSDFTKEKSYAFLTNTYSHRKLSKLGTHFLNRNSYFKKLKMRLRRDSNTGSPVY